MVILLRSESQSVLAPRQAILRSFVSPPGKSGIASLLGLDISSGFARQPSAMQLSVSSQ
jgi:hypothetical protein